MEKSREIVERLQEIIISEFNKGTEYIDCDEMMKALDMLKDASMATYYNSITSAMENTPTPFFDDFADEDGIYEKMGYASHEKNKYMSPEDYRRIKEITRGRMYYTEMPAEHPRVDEHYGKSWEHRAKYIESKETGDANSKMQHLEDYAKALSDDVTEMIRNASDNERQMLRTKMQMLTQKI